METLANTQKLIVVKYKYDNEYRIYNNNVNVDNLLKPWLKKDAIIIANKKETAKILNQFKKIEFKNILEKQTKKSKDFEFTKIYFGNNDLNLAIVKNI